MARYNSLIKSKPKKNSPQRTDRNPQAALKLRPLVLHLLLGMGVSSAFAGPQGGSVVDGNAQIVQTSNRRTDIFQQTDRAIIDWKSFNIAPSEHVNFSQPSASSFILNRVTGHQASQILGRLTANGGVALVNPQGIYFGPESQVNVGSLIASTADTLNTHFMEGKLQFDIPGASGAEIVNDGHIAIGQGGLAALVAPHLRNRGVIEASLGQVVLAAGPAFSLDLHGDKLFQFLLDEAALASLQDANGQPLANLIDASGQISAEGGRVLLQAHAVETLLESVVNLSGVVRAQQVKVTGDRVSLLPSAVVIGEGGVAEANQVLIGGEFQGKGQLPNAREVQIAEGANIQTAEGGEVIVWSDGKTRFEGSISAPGGFVEVSGREHLNFSGDVKAQKLLLDPRFLVIVEGTDAQNPADSEIPDDLIGNQVINQLLLAGTDVSLQATDGIFVNAPINGKASESETLGSTGAKLSLEATQGLIALNHNITTNNGNVVLKASTVTSAENTTIDAGNAKISVNASGQVSLQGLAARELDIVSSNAGVVLNQPVGGSTLGSSTFERIAVRAAGNLVTNGLNLKGIGVAQDTGASGGSDAVFFDVKNLPEVPTALSLDAGGNIVINFKIVVDDGQIKIGNGNTQAIVLKDSIYSRNGYAISLNAPLNLSLGEQLNTCFNAGEAACVATVPIFNADNYEVVALGSQQFAVQLKDGITSEITAKVPKIVVSNNNDRLYLDPKKGTQKITLMSPASGLDQVLLKVQSFTNFREAEGGGLPADAFKDFSQQNNTVAGTIEYLPSMPTKSIKEFSVNVDKAFQSIDSDNRDSDQKKSFKETVEVLSKITETSGFSEFLVVESKGSGNVILTKAELREIFGDGTEPNTKVSQGFVLEGGGEVSTASTVKNLAKVDVLYQGAIDVPLVAVSLDASGNIFNPESSQQQLGAANGTNANPGFKPIGNQISGQIATPDLVLAPTPAPTQALPPPPSPPPSVTSAPPTVTSGPPAVTSSPPAVTSSPPAVTSSPPAVTSSPPAVTSGPPAVTSSPPAVTSGPPAVTSSPPAVTSGPPAVTSSPPAVTSGPPPVSGDPTQPPGVEADTPVVTDPPRPEQSGGTVTEVAANESLINDNTQRTKVDETVNEPELIEVVFQGTSKARLADLGNSSPVSGASVDVFDASVCVVAPGDSNIDDSESSTFAGCP